MADGGSKKNARKVQTKPLNNLVVSKSWPSYAFTLKIELNERNGSKNIAIQLAQNTTLVNSSVFSSSSNTINITSIHNTTRSFLNSVLYRPCTAHFDFRKIHSKNSYVIIVSTGCSMSKCQKVNQYLNNF